MKIMIDSKRVPELRRKLMEKLLEMFDPDTTFEYREIEHLRNNGTVDTTEKRFVMHNKKKEISVKRSEFLDKSEIAKIFRLESGESKKFLKSMEERGKTSLADIVEILIGIKVFAVKRKKKI